MRLGLPSAVPRAASVFEKARKTGFQTL